VLDALSRWLADFMSNRASAILLTGGPSHLSSSAETYARALFNLVYASHHERSESNIKSDLWTALGEESVDYLFSFLSPAIIPENLLTRVTKAAINFHPAPPEHPGVGSASYAIYDEESHFGVTVHRMHKVVDSGEILKVLRFPILPNDTCESLFDRAM